MQYTFNIANDKELETFYQLMWDKVRIDGAKPPHLCSPISLYLSCYVDGVYSGIFIFEPRFNNSVIVHGGMIINRSYAHELLEKAIDLFYDLCPQIDIIYSEIPSKYMSTYNFMKKHFTPLCDLPQTVKIDDVKYDVKILMRKR